MGLLLSLKIQSLEMTKQAHNLNLSATNTLTNFVYVLQYNKDAALFLIVTQNLSKSIAQKVHPKIKIYL